MGKGQEGDDEEDGSEEGRRRAKGQEGDEEDGSDEEGRRCTEGQEGDEEVGSDEAQGHEGRRRAKGQEGHEVGGELGVTRGSLSSNPFSSRMKDAYFNLVHAK